MAFEQSPLFNLRRQYHKSGGELGKFAENFRSGGGDYDALKKSMSEWKERRLASPEYKALVADHEKKYGPDSRGIAGDSKGKSPAKGAGKGAGPVERFSMRDLAPEGHPDRLKGAVSALGTGQSKGVFDIARSNPAVAGIEEMPQTTTAATTLLGGINTPKKRGGKLFAPLKGGL